MADSPTFAQVGQSKLYELQRPTKPAAADAPVVGFLAAEDTAAGTTLTLAEAWAEGGGIFLFLDAAPSDTATFVDAVRFFVGRPANSHSRFLWIDAVDRVPSPGVLARLRARPGADAPSAGPATWQILESASLVFANYALRLGAGCTLSLDDDGDGVTITPSTSPSPNVVFTAPGGDFPISGDSAEVSFGEPQPGVVQCRLTLNDPGGTGGTATPSDLERLDVGCAFFAPAPAGDGSVIELFYPVLVQPATALGLFASFDPLRPTEGDRTALGLVDSQAAAPVFDSAFVTARGYGWQLTPQAGTVQPSARLVFGRRPLWTQPYQPTLYYLTFEGPFLLSQKASNPEPAVSQPPTSGLPVPEERLLGGIAGAEYLGLTSKDGNVLHFVPGGAAFAPSFTFDSPATGLRAAADPSPARAATSAGDPPPALTTVGTTAYAFVTPAAAGTPIYNYAQPRSALLYEVPDPASPGAGADVLDFLEVPSGQLPSTFTPPGSAGQAEAVTPPFPLMPYTRVAADQLDRFAAFETEVLSPVRRAVLRELTEGQGSIPATEGTEGITPKGLQVELSDNARVWKTLTLAHTVSGPLLLEQVRDQLRDVVQSNRVFLVAADGETFQTSCTVPSTFELEIADWRFQVAPDQWFDATRASDQNAILILKFCPGTLADLVQNLASWPWPDVARYHDGTPAQTQQALLDLFASARADVEAAEAKGQTSPFTYLVRQVIDNEDWNGMVVFNVTVPLDQLPPQLQSLATGIDPARFYAHHVGFATTPIGLENGQVTSGDSALFGLIDYQDTQDLVFQKGVTYDFKVLSLQVLFENSQIASFASRIELMVNELFGAPALLLDTEHGNNVLLDGVYQHHGDEGTYQFRQIGPSLFSLEASALLSVEVLSAQFVTLPVDPNQPELVRSQFVLGGNLYFVEPPFFDPFSFGPLGIQTLQPSGDEPDDVFDTIYGPHAVITPARERWRVLLEAGADPASGAGNGHLAYGNLVITMQFSKTDLDQRSFAFAPSGMSFDLSQSVARTQSLFENFPLELTGLLASPPVVEIGELVSLDPSGGTPSAQTPMDLGYVSVSAPLEQGTLSTPWFGLVFEIDLGTLGSLAGGAGIRLEVLAAWSRGTEDEDAALFLGLKFPGSSGLGAALGLEGVLKLGFRNIDFLVSQTEQGRAYMMRMRQLALSLLGVSFPPGNNDVYLFGDPQGGANTTLGWYACYADGSNDDKNKDAAVRRALAGRRNRRGAG